MKLYFGHFVEAHKELKTEKSTEIALNIVKESLSKLEFDFNKLPAKWWICLLRALDFKSDVEKVNQKALFSLLSKFEKKLLTIQEWELLYKLCLRGGLFRLSYNISSKENEYCNEKLEKIILKSLIKFYFK